MKKFILAEKLKEEIGDQRIRAAVFHTFNFDPEFFENYLLPLFLPDIPFGENKIQNTILWKKYQQDLPPVTIYCDFHAKAQKGINLDYVVRPIDIPRYNGIKPCYHPKHSFVLLEDWSLIVLTGSNNLTEAGWCSNLEGVNFFKLKNKEEYPRTFKDELKSFNRKIRLEFFDEEFNDEDSLSEADNVLDSFFRSTGYTDDNGPIFFDTRNKTASHLQTFAQLLEFIKDEFNDGEGFRKIEIISPYFSPSTTLFNELKDITECNDISFSIPFENTDLVGIDKKLFDEVTALGMKWKAIKGMNHVKGYRFNHSKIYHVLGKDSTFTIVGSVNFTQMAWKGVKAGGNYESAIVHQSESDVYEELLENYPLENLSFSGNKDEENHVDTRIDAFNLEFVIDWRKKKLKVVNRNERKQKGYIDFGNLPSVSINKSKDISLNEEQVTFLSNTPLIKVKPSNQDIYFYYYPIHKNIESKPLPEHLNLNDSELLQLWMDLDESNSKDSTLRIIDKFIDRITDEAGDIKVEELNGTSSTLNLMATHLSGLIKLNRKIFSKSNTLKGEVATRKIREYYLFTNNVDTLIGYRNLLKKMSGDGRLNNGFYWLLLNIIDRFFYKQLTKRRFNTEIPRSQIDSVRKEITKDIKELSKSLQSDKLTEKHMNWILKMLENDLK